MHPSTPTRSDPPPPAWKAWLPSGPVLGLLSLLLLFILVLQRMGKLPQFASFSNIQGILQANSVTAAAALGVLLVVLSGGIDLSVGSVIALTAAVAIQTFRATDSSALTVLAALAAAVACGVANGLMVTLLKLPPFVATLGMVSVARGAAIWLLGRTAVSFPYDRERPAWVEALSTRDHSWLGFGLSAWSVLLLAGLVAVLLRYTVFGLHVRAIGSNEPAARMCGVPVDRDKVWTYALSGLCVGWAGLLAFAQSNGGQPDAALGLELDVIAAVVIGGASLAGGYGTVAGTLLGALILGVLANGVAFCGVPVEVKHVLVGTIVVVNTALSGWGKKAS
ncbi:MAG: ABC transporter permease [Gemmataceae bacterium]|nr:ABC transporter permease [Gemmataceae bacterium]